MKAWLHKHYHWLVACVVLLQLGICGGTDNNLSGLHLIPVTEFLGISRTQYALAFSIRSSIAMVATFYSGMVLRRFGYRKVVLCAGFLYVAGYCLLATMTNGFMLMAGLALLGTGATFCGTSGASYIINAWFRKHRGTVLGLVTAATGIGGSLLCLGQTWAMDTYSWRGSYVLCIMFLLVIFLLMVSTIRNTPQEIGLTPYGQDAPVQEKRKHRMPATIIEGRSMKALWRSPSFYLMLLCTFLSGTGVYLVFSVIVPYLTDCGFSTTQAAGLQSAMLLILSGGKLLSGWLSDRIGPQRVNWGCAVLGVLGMLAFTVADNMLLATLAVVLYTFSLPMVTTLIPLLALPLFGYRAQTQYTGILLSVTYVATTLSSLITNGIYDAVGSYRPAFYLAAGLGAGVLVLYPVLYGLSRKEFAAESA